MNKITDIKTFFELLKYSKDLEQNNKFLLEEDSDKYNQLSKNLVVIQCNRHFREKIVYVDLLELFVANEIEPENFCLFFMAQHDNISDESNKIIQNFETNRDELSTLLLENQNLVDDIIRIGESLAILYANCDLFLADADSSSVSSLTTEKILRELSTELLSTLRSIQKKTVN